jgi:hypothetical protein
VPADSPTTASSPPERATTSSACVPIEPVDPRMTIRFIRRRMIVAAAA